MHCIYVIYDVVGCIIRTGDLEFNIHFFSRFSFFIIPTRHILIRDTYTHTMCVSLKNCFLIFLKMKRGKKWCNLVDIIIIYILNQEMKRF